MNTYKTVVHSVTSKYGVATQVVKEVKAVKIGATTDLLHMICKKERGVNNKMNYC